MNKPKVALVHDILVQNGGAEKTLEAICELFPDAPIYTVVYRQENFADSVISSKKVIVPKSTNNLFNSVPILYKYLTFLVPLVFEGFNFDDYDIVISDSSAYSKGVLTKPNQLHISYIHTPPRFLYNYSVENSKRNAWYFKPLVTLIDHYLKIWDFNAAQRANVLACNSYEIKRRIEKFYKREAKVIYPPVELGFKSDMFNKLSSELLDIKDNIINNNFYLVAGRLAEYKNFDAVIQAFNELPNLNLLVIGTGPEENKLKTMAAQNVHFLGRIPDDQKHYYMKYCKGLINAVEDEDFGIVPVEVLSHGNPVLAHRSAGHLETIQDGITGMYFDDLSTEKLKNKILEFDSAIDKKMFKKKVLLHESEKFSKENFKSAFANFVDIKWKSFMNNIQR